MLDLEVSESVQIRPKSIRAYSLNDMFSTCRHPFASISLVSDVAQQSLYLPKDKQTLYGRGETKPRGVSVCALLVVLCTMYIPAAGLSHILDPIRTEWIIPPVILQDETAANLVGALLNPPTVFSMLLGLMPYLRSSKFIGVCFGGFLPIDS